MAAPFPFREWMTFQEQASIQMLLPMECRLSSLSAWPSVQDWQDAADAIGIWEAMGHRLRFTFERKPGQRAKRKLPKILGRSYEAAILERLEIPTREQNLHDFFNAIIWLNFPRAKHALHAKAYEVQQAWSSRHDRSQRCPLADRLTCFDEGGIVFDNPRASERVAVEELFLSRRDDEKKAFVDIHREHFSFFGHGMLEGMMGGRTAIHASCIILDPGAGTCDERLAAYLNRFGEKSPNHGSILAAWLTS